MREKSQKTLGWGVATDKGSELWDTRPIFAGEFISYKDKLKLIFYPKKLLLYRHIDKARRRKLRANKKWGKYEKLRILDVGCGTGAAAIEMKKMWGKDVEVVGLDVVQMQVDLAKERIREYGVWANLQVYNGQELPFAEQSFDVVYSSDVLGHVQDVPAWLHELSRVLKYDGTLAMFAESKLGRHAYLRNYLFKRGLNTDPHAQYHISLYNKTKLRELLDQAGFEIEKMYSTFWAKFFVHPDELYTALQGQQRFFFLRQLNRMLYWLKKKTHPVSTALAELYGLVEMLTLGRWLEAQGYIILAKKK